MNVSGCPIQCFFLPLRFRNIPLAAWHYSMRIHWRVQLTATSQHWRQGFGADAGDQQPLNRGAILKKNQVKIIGEKNVNPPKHRCALGRKTRCVRYFAEGWVLQDGVRQGDTSSSTSL